MQKKIPQLTSLNRETGVFEIVITSDRQFIINNPKPEPVELSAFEWKSQVRSLNDTVKPVIENPPTITGKLVEQIRDLELLAEELEKKAASRTTTCSHCKDIHRKFPDYLLCSYCGYDFSNLTNYGGYVDVI